MSGSTNRIVFLSFVHERASIRGMGMNITKIIIKKKGGVRNVE